jgi:hypothetical protein
MNSKRPVSLIPGTGRHDRQCTRCSVSLKVNSFTIIDPDLLSFLHFLVRIPGSIVHLAGDASGVVSRRVPNEWGKWNGASGLWLANMRRPRMANRAFSQIFRPLCDICLYPGNAASTRA